MHRKAALGALFAVLSLTLLAVPGVAQPTSPGGPAAPTASAGTPLPQEGPVGASHPASLQLPTHAGPLLASGPFYTQEGATLGQLNNSNSVAGANSLSLKFTLVKSPYPVGYELNGLSDTGDWYQVVIADNWPGCASGFEEVTEVWAVGDVSGPVTCDPTVTLSKGDSIQLGLNFTPTHNACLDVRDITTSTSHIVCQAQPDSGGTEFSLLGGVANSDGYYTGPMTEVVNMTASSCPDYKSMPRLDYRSPSGTWVSQYTAWSDEFDAGSGSICYIGSGTTTSLARTDLTTHFEDTATGTSYGPHWAAGQNFSHFDSSVAWRFQTDPVPMTGDVMAADRLTVGLGTPVHLNVTISGGTSPYTALWYVNGTLQSTTALNFTFTPPALGLFPIVADGVDAQLNVLAPSNPMTIDVTGPLSVPPIVASPASGGVDVGQTVTFQSNPTGGIPPRTFVWGGLPSGCVGANSSSISCTPFGPGLFNVTVRVSDTNNSTVLSPTLAYRVYLQPAASLSASLTQLDVGQTTDLVVNVTGGGAPYSFSWSGTPPGCPAPLSGILLCTPSAAGTFNIQVAVTDANGGLSITGTVSLFVHAPLQVTLASDRTVGEVGQPVSFVASPNGGSSGYSYAWSGLPAGCASLDQAKLTCTPASAGTLAVSVQVTDSLGTSVTSAVRTVAEYPALAVSVTVAPSLTEVGSVVTFDASASGGNGTLRYQWTGVPASCYPPPSSSFDCQIADSGTYPVTIHVWDALGGNATANATLTVGNGPGPSGSGGLSLFALVGIGIGLGAVLLGVAIALARRRGRAPPPTD